MMIGCRIGISTDLLQNFVVDKICLSIVVIKNPIVQPAAVAFFFFSICRQLGGEGGRAVEEKERERNIWLRRRREMYTFFFKV